MQRPQIYEIGISGILGCPAPPVGAPPLQDGRIECDEGGLGPCGLRIALDSCGTAPPQDHLGGLDARGRKDQHDWLVWLGQTTGRGGIQSCPAQSVGGATAFGAHDLGGVTEPFAVHQGENIGKTLLRDRRGGRIDT